MVYLFAEPEPDHTAAQKEGHAAEDMEKRTCGEKRVVCRKGQHRERHKSIYGQAVPVLHHEAACGRERGKTERR